MQNDLITGFYLILNLVIIATAGSFVNLCLDKRDSFRQTVVRFLAGIVFGALTGYIVGLFFMDKKWGRLVAAGCSLFTRNSYEKAKTYFEKFTNKKL